MLLFLGLKLNSDILMKGLKKGPEKKFNLIEFIGN